MLPYFAHTTSVRIYSRYTAPSFEKLHFKCNIYAFENLQCSFQHNVFLLRDFALASYDQSLSRLGLVCQQPAALLKFMPIKFLMA